MRELQTTKRKKKGFTLIELIIVIAVIGIIAAIAVPSLMGTKETFKVKSDEKSAQTIARAVELLAVDETIGATADGTITITPADSGAPTVALSDGLEKDTNKDKIVSSLQASLTDLKKPQETSKTKFVIKLDDGKVTDKVTE